MTEQNEAIIIDKDSPHFCVGLVVSAPGKSQIMWK